MQGTTKTWADRPALPGILATACAAAVHLRLLGEFFASDDFLHLFRIVNNGFLEFVLTPHCGHALVARNALFYAFHWLLGLEAWTWFAVVLLSHLVNVGLIFRILRRHTGRPWLAGFLAALFGTSPISMGTLSWYSVYGHCLATTLVLWILDEVSRLDEATRPIPLGALARWYVLLVLASNLFGVGVAVALTAGPVLFCLLPNRSDAGRIGLIFGSLVVVVPGLYLGLRRLFDALYGGLDPGASLPALDLATVGQILRSLIDLIAYGFSSLLLGGLAAVDRGGLLLAPEAAVSLGRAFPIFWSLLGLGLALVGWAALRASRRERLRILGLVMWVVAAYGLIAVGRVGLIGSLHESPETLAIVIRYHYLGPALIALILGLCLAKLDEARQTGGRTIAVLAGSWLLVLLVAAFTSSGPLRALFPESGRRVFLETVEGIRSEIEAAPAGGPAILRNRRFDGIEWGMRTYFAGCHLPIHPGRAAIFVTAFPENTVDGRRVYFEEPRARVRNEVDRMPKTRIAALIISPEQARALREAGPVGPGVK